MEKPGTLKLMAAQARGRHGSKERAKIRVNYQPRSQESFALI